MITRFLWQGMGPSLRVGVLFVLAIGIILPLLNQLMPATSAFYVPAWVLQLIGKYLCFASLALAVDLVWGFCGILTLGHAAFFALGGYCMGMYLMRQIGSRGQYGNPLLPDFMVFLNYKELPWFWHGFDQFWFAAIMVVLVPSVLALALGWFAFRSRVTGVYLSIITQAMTFALMLAFFRNDMGLGGNNGMTDFKDILGFSVQSDATRATLCFASALVLAIFLVIAGAVVSSRFGKALTAVRDAESRMRFLGYRVEGYKLFVFVLSAAMAGVAGALYVPQVGIINPSEFSPGNSIEAVLWVAVGGRGTLIGPIIGAFAVNFGKTYLTGALPEVWLFALGALFIAVTLFLPKGIVGLWGQIRNRGTARKARAAGMSMTEQRSTSALLYLSGVTVSFDGFKALNNLSLLVEPGEMRAIIGPNGAGKTTMMDVVTGKTRPDEGEVVFDGKADLTKLDEADIATLGIGRKFQKPTVFENHTVRDNLVLALAGLRSWYKLLLAAPTKAENARLDEILSIIRMEAQQHMLAARLSHGQKQWLEIGMLLAQDPKLLLVDEPVAGMTDVETETTAQVLREINRTHSVVVVEHDMSFVRALGVKVTVLHEGSMLAEGTLDQVSADQRVVEVYLGR